MKNVKKQNFSNILKILFILCLFTIPFFVFGQASKIYFENIEHEKGPFLQWHGDPSTSISIMWETNEEMDSVVCYSEDPENMNDLIITDVDEVKVHKIEIENLEPDTQYYYKISSTSDQNFLGKDEIFQFKTASDATQSFNVSIIGNTQTNQYFQSNTMERVADSMDNYNQDFIIHTGNLWKFHQYEEDATKKNQLNADRFFTTFYPLTSTRPLMAAIGDEEYAVIGGNYDIYFNQPRGNYRSGYSFNYENIHFTFFSAPKNTYDLFDDYYPWLGDSYQELLDWLQTDLADANSGSNKIVIIRCPLDSSEFFSSEFFSSVQINNRLRTILNENDVSCVFMSGNKCYEHWNVDGLDYFITGCSGTAPEAYGTIKNDDVKKIALESNFVNLKVTSDSLQIEARTFDDQLIEEVEIHISN